MRCLVTFLTGLLSAASFGDADEVRRGQYLTNILGCEGCHTQGRMVGDRVGQPLAGSDIGIAYSRFVDTDNPPIVFAPNLTPDKATGLGDWRLQDIVKAIRHGVNARGQDLASVMPWLSYRQLKRQDAEAIAAYLMSLPPTSHVVPEPVPQGTLSESMYVRFGIYIFMPHQFKEASQSVASDGAMPRFDSAARRASTIPARRASAVPAHRASAIPARRASAVPARRASAVPARRAPASESLH